MPKLVPINDQVLVKLDDRETKTEGGVLLPDNAKKSENAPRFATVMEVGNGILTPHGVRVPLDVKPKDRIIINSFAGTNIPGSHEFDDQLLVPIGDCLAVIERT